MMSKRANEITVVSLSAKTATDLEDVVNDWLKEQRENTMVHAIDFERTAVPLVECTAWLVVSRDK